MNYKKKSEKVSLLKDGQIVMINGLPFSAKRCDGFWPCAHCNVDCLCHDDVAEICTELDIGSKTTWYLHLES